MGLGVLGPDSTHTTYKQNGRRPSCNTQCTSQTSPVVGVAVWGRNARKRRSHPLSAQPLPSHSPCFPVSLCVLLCLFVWKSVPKMNKNAQLEHTQAKTQRRNRDWTLVFFFDFVSYENCRHCWPNRNHPLRISLSIPVVVVAELHFFSFQKSFVVFTGRIFSKLCCSKMLPMFRLEGIFFYKRAWKKKKCRGWRKLMWNKERGSSLYVSVCDSGPLYLSRFSPEHPTHTRHNYIIDAMYIYKADVCFVLCFGGGGGM